MMNFVFKTRNFVSKTRKCVLQTRNFVSKTRNCALKMINFAGIQGGRLRHVARCETERAGGVLESES